MPPVFKPSSLSRARLWSCAAGMRTAVFPSQSAKQEASGPVIKDSMTQVSPASPKALSDIISFTASIVSCFVVGKSTPFPAARPEAFTTCLSLSSRDSTYLMASAGSVNVRYFAVGMPCSCKKSFEKALLASSSAAALEGPKHKTSGHSTLIWSTNPATSGASGPTTTILAPTSLVRAITLSLLWLAPLFLIFGFSSDAVPPFPGQHKTSATSGDLARATARACSLPPEPTTITVSFRFVGPTACSTALPSSLDRAVRAAPAKADLSESFPQAAASASLTEPPSNEALEASYATTTVSPDKIFDRTRSASEEEPMYSVTELGRQ
mmetsp:Transcript_16601/g.41588  ORF Transcript_16601/g.41588 Transcript_16601/m.41588 type:complete len:324 (-) Transcript_16601:309-1280(-)